MHSIGLDLHIPSRYQTLECPSSLLQRRAKPPFPPASFGPLGQACLGFPAALYRERPLQIPAEYFSRKSAACLHAARHISFALLLYSLSDEAKLTHSWRGWMSQGRPGCHRSPTSPSHSMRRQHQVIGRQHQLGASCVCCSPGQRGLLFSKSHSSQQAVCSHYETRYIVMTSGTETLPTTRYLLWRNRENATFFFLFFFALWMRCNLFF